MKIDDQTSFSLEAELSQIAFSDASAALIHEAKEHGLPFSRESSQVVQVMLPYGVISLRQRDDMVLLQLKAMDKTVLHQLKEGVLEHMGIGDATYARALRWQGDLIKNAPLPDFAELTVVSTQIVSNCFQRITLAGQGVERFLGSPIHFRLLLPADLSRDPVYPHLDENGRSVWPSGADNLRRPVYTVRRVNTDELTFDFDVFLHEGGPTGTWAQKVQSGEKLGILGPVGGGLMQAQQVLLAGDETALPAIARICEALPHTAKGAVLISLAKGNRYENLQLPDGVSFKQIERSNASELEQLLEEAKASYHKLGLPRTSESSLLFFATKKPVARKARTYFFEELNFAKENAYIAGFWD
ncbi:siderophore-interacting protein [Polycladidibacter hongkongensis]|uniref:siderophore-interacting protein n=1 Tax=Polycladidibacter hongkongensis TaxID=1647556 RepID=UPI0008326BCB|nr:siderophore-interacting protein [Pseudovibrio hongkongensis]